MVGHGNLDGNFFQLGPQKGINIKVTPFITFSLFNISIKYVHAPLYSFHVS
jgi:hypothetical protein